MAEITANVAGSVALTPYSSPARTRVSPTAHTMPAAMPATASAAPWRTTSCSTSRRCAPSAIRMPISRVRCATAYAITP
jgi:hypothetical protein